MVLLAFDGSDHAAHAIESAGRLLGGGPAAVVCVMPPVELPAPMPLGGTAHLAELETEHATRAQHTADRGGELARAAGFDPVEVRVEREEDGVWETIVALGRALDVEVIVVGGRSRHGFAAAVRPSEADGVVHHAGRPVLVVP